MNPSRGLSFLQAPALPCFLGSYVFRLVQISCRTMLSNNFDAETNGESVSAVNPYQRCSPDFDRRCITILAKQLGYTPCNVVRIGASVSLGDDYGSCVYPVTAVLYPLNVNNLSGRYSPSGGVKPFPTTIWLTCPVVHSLVSVLEGQGKVNELQARLQDKHSAISRQYVERMKEAHRKYAEYRWNLLTEEDRLYVEEQGWTTALRDVGVAGMRSAEAVKCLHTHYAHYLTFPEHDNVIGKWVQEQLEEQGLLRPADRNIRDQQQSLLERALPTL